MLSNINVEKEKVKKKKLLPCLGIHFRSHYQRLKAYLICFV
jgi:hypothetical protein